MADEEPENEVEESEETETEEASGKPKWLLFALVGVVVLAVGAGGTFFLLPGGEPDPDAESAEEAVAEEEEAEEEGPLPEFAALEPLVVNIRDRDRDRFLKLNIEVELSDPKLAEELEKRSAQIRDVVISLLGDQSFEEIRTLEGKNKLREGLMTRMNAHLKTGQIHRVFFTEFVVQ